MRYQSDIPGSGETAGPAAAGTPENSGGRIVVPIRRYLQQSGKDRQDAESQERDPGEYHQDDAAMIPREKPTEMSESERLARIETRIDTMTSAVNELKELMARMVRVEEKYIYTDGAVQRMGRSLDALEKRIAVLESAGTAMKVSTRTYERIAWLSATGVLGLITAKMKGWL